MNIFNSLGSNYNFGFALKSLFTIGANNKEKLTDFLEKKYSGKAVLFYKGREAITHALEILNLPKDSLVAINGFTCVAVFNSIRKAGYEPLCLDLEQTEGLNFTAKSLEKALSQNKKIKVVIVQNTLGYPCDIDRIVDLCKKHNLILVEDLAHCVETRYPNGKEAGTAGDFTVLSFSQDKIIDAVSGGALIIKNKKFINKAIQQFNNLNNGQILKDRLYPLFAYLIRKAYPIGIGKSIHFLFKKLGLMSNVLNESFYDYYSLPDSLASLALYQFELLSYQIIHRRKVAEIYVSMLPEKMLMFSSENTKKVVSLSSNLRFPIFLKNRSDLIRTLKNKGVYVADIWYSDVAPECPNAVADSKIILNLPTHINVSENNAKNICMLINKIAHK